MSDASIIAAFLALAIWVYLLAFRDGFWRADQFLRGREDASGRRVVAIVPARNEADVVGRAVDSLLRQDYVPHLSVVLVDDESDDGTAARAREAAQRCGAEDRLVVVRGASRPSGWTGKMWAVAQGVDAASTRKPDYLLLTDADIAHDRDNLRALVAQAERGRYDLVSLMVRLHCRSVVERLLIPAFVFFFQKLYPFGAVNDSRKPTAAAAGGCILLRANALARAGGIASIRDVLIDDCALARRVKMGGPVWLGLTRTTVSLRVYAEIGPIWQMVARSAYNQLGYSPLALIVTILGLGITYLAAPIAVTVGIVTGGWILVALGAAVWGLMTIAYRPTLRVYELSLFWAATLPLAAFLYMLMTLDSAWRHSRGRGGAWKGRLDGGLARAGQPHFRKQA